MTSPLQSLIATGTKLWLDSVDPDLVKTNRALGATGATSNPIIISDLIKTGRFDDDLAKLLQRNEAATTKLRGSSRIALSARRKKCFLPVWKEHEGRRRLCELRARSAARRSRRARCRRTSASDRYIELGKQWSAGPSESHDQSAGDAGRYWCAGRTVCGGRDAQRHADFHDAAIRSGSRRDLARCAAPQVARRISRACTAFSSRAWMCTRRSTCPICRRPRRGKSASWARSDSGKRTRSSGRRGRRRCSKRSSSPARARRSRKIRRGSMSRRSRAATFKRIRRRRTKRWKRAAARSRAWSTRCRRPMCWRRSTRKSTCRSWKTIDARGRSSNSPTRRRRCSN